MHAQKKKKSKIHHVTEMMDLEIAMTEKLIKID
jgi:hypothetical protein